MHSHFDTVVVMLSTLFCDLWLMKCATHTLHYSNQYGNVPCWRMVMWNYEGNSLPFCLYARAEQKYLFVIPSVSTFKLFKREALTHESRITRLNFPTPRQVRFCFKRQLPGLVGGYKTNWRTLRKKNIQMHYNRQHKFPRLKMYPPFLARQPYNAPPCK